MGESALSQAFFSIMAEEDSPGTVRVNLHRDNRITIRRITMIESLFGDGEEEESVSEIASYFESITAMALSENGAQLYAGTQGGTLLHWDISETPVLIDTVPAFKQPITALAMVFGSQSLAVGTQDGSLTTWMGVRDSDASTTKKLRRIHTLTSHDAPVVSILPSRRDKSLLSRSADGKLALDHMTSERHLFTFDLDSVMVAAMNDRGHGLAALTPNGLQLLDINNPHPEVSFKTLFTKVWYENYDSPEYAWQSSSGSDDFEPKLSITPLLFGTIKGTFYAMIFALPLAIFGAVYVSQFAPPHLQQIIKPTVEIMASVPSVVIGFLIALVLAPFIETHLVALILCLLLIPLSFVGFLYCWHLGQRFRPVRELKVGYEFLLVIPVLVGGVMLSYYIAPFIEQRFFGGNFSQYLFHNFGTTYDQRNCIIIAFGLGFCVIPIIFSIAEDSLSNVPSGLSHASLALGASRWQTVWRVVLPSASPGIFAGSMIGLGRAVGETMIILMATGNTPIMDWSMFNGMRTLAANIAVEIPEAPVDGSLYRVLFLCSVLLFCMTFIVNTGAELIRDRLRKKYARY
jgi:phosphate transport system permease protein